MMENDDHRSFFNIKQWTKTDMFDPSQRLPSPAKLSSAAAVATTDIVEADAENEIGFMENSVPYEDVFLNGTEPAEYASNSFAKSRICVGTSIICLLGAFIVTILVGSFVISPSVGLVTAILIGRSFKKAF